MKDFLSGSISDSFVEETEPESWTIKKAECQRMYAFELWWWRRLLRVSGLQGDQTSRSWRKSVLNIHWKDCAEAEAPTLWSWCKELTRWKRPWCWERLKAGGAGDDRGWDGWMTSLTLWTLIWANCGRKWRTGKPGVLQSMGLQSQIWLSNWTTTKNWTGSALRVEKMLTGSGHSGKERHSMGQAKA